MRDKIRGKRAIKKGFTTKQIVIKKRGPRLIKKYIKIKC
jgi:hypothetical protein